MEDESKAVNTQGKHRQVDPSPQFGTDHPVTETIPDTQGNTRKSRRAHTSRSVVQKIDFGVTPAGLAPVVEAILLSVDRPVTTDRLAEGIGLVKPTSDEPNAACDPAELAAGGAMVVDTIKLLNEQYTQSSRSFRIESVAGGYRLMTLPAFAERITAYHQTRLSGKLSRASVETLAIIAYKQPLTKAGLESIRGVSCGEVLKTLMDRRLVTIKGRAEELGRPMLYGTTKTFLDQFGLESIKDLPTAAELKVNG